MEGSSLEELTDQVSEPRIAKQLEALAVPIEDLEPHPDNARRGDIEQIGQSLLRFGQLRPVVVQESSGFIVAGNHVYRAAAELLHWDRLAAVVEELDDHEAKAYLLADNRLAELGTYDDQALAGLIRGVADDEGPGLQATGYPLGGDPLARLLARLDPEPGEEFGLAGGSEDDDQYRCPNCEFGWSGNPKPPSE